MGPLTQSATDFAAQSEKLSHQKAADGEVTDAATEARFVTPNDPVLVTAEGHRLPGVPLLEAHKLNLLREAAESDGALAPKTKNGNQARDQSAPESSRLPKVPTGQNGESMQKSGEGSLQRAMPPSHTNPLFPPLPLYGPPSILRNFQCVTFRISSFFLSLAFLGVIILGAVFTSIPGACSRLFQRLTLRNPDAKRPFHEEEMRRQRMRKETNRSWKRRNFQKRAQDWDDENPAGGGDGFIPTEGGPDPVRCDAAYYARRVGLDVEELQVQTEDGFILDLWHVYDPKQHTPLTEAERADLGPDLATAPKRERRDARQKHKFPVLLMHGLLQSAGAYCVNDDDSLAFFLCKSGYDVWLGNNRCGFRPRHALLDYSDPRMWCWNIRQMGVFDLPALVSRVLYETGFEKIGLIAHSQGTTQTMVALAKEQRPDLGEKLTVFCALAPAAYAGPLIGKMYLKFMRVITPAMFRVMFGIHAFIPFMMSMHGLLPPRIYGYLGYKVFSFMFNWSDKRWDRGLRDRMFQFSPVYVSSESMRWWLGRECFAKHKCILATREERRAEDREDNEAEGGRSGSPSPSETHRSGTGADVGHTDKTVVETRRRKPKGSTAWYNAQAPPFAMWVCGSDDLVDGKRLLRRFEKGREPHVRVVHSKMIPNYEHLDVLWAMDATEKVFTEVREVLWKTCNVRDVCQVPRGCEDVARWAPRDVPLQGADYDQEQSSSSGSSSESLPL